MGLLGNLFGKKDETAADGKEQPSGQESSGEGKYNEPCSLCGAAGTDKKWAGKYWHVKCIRKLKRAGKGML